jgi:hypothetical protein
MTIEIVWLILLTIQIVGASILLGFFIGSQKALKVAANTTKKLVDTIPQAVTFLIAQMIRDGVIEIKNPGESIFFEMHVRNGSVFLEFSKAKNEVEKLLFKLKKG